MELDLRFNRNINSDLVELFDQISFSNRENFNNFIENLSRPLIRDIDWWAQNPASRNTYTSPLFHYFCSIKFFIEVLNTGEYAISDVLVDSLELKKVLDKALEKNNFENIKVIYRPGKVLKRKRLAKKLFYFQYFIWKRYTQNILIRINDKFNKDSIKTNPITIIDTFLSPDFIDEDRWYGNFWNNIQEHLKKDIFFVPTIIDTPLRKISLLCKNARINGKNIIFKDQFLRIDDFIFAYKHKSRAKKLAIKKILVNDLDLSGLVAEDIQNNRDIQTLIESLLTYRFISKLKQQGVDLRLAIDWFEGHSIDKLWNLSIKNYFPNIKRIGYETYRSFPYYLSTFPIQIERDAETIPDVFAVQGRHCVDCVREFLPNQDVIIIPAFKYNHVWEHDIQTIKEKKQVLVALPISLDSTARILKILIDAYTQDPRLNGSDIEFILKRHPKNSTIQILDYIDVNLPQKFTFTEEKSFPNLLKNSTVLVTEASSTCIEAMAYGISVIVIENSSGLTYDPIPKGTNKKLYRKSKTKDSLTNSLFDLLNMDEKRMEELRELGLDFKNNFFEPITENGIYRFLDIGDTDQ
jgi:hypothetical protein